MIQSREHMGYRDEYTSNNNQPDVMKADFLGGVLQIWMWAVWCADIFNLSEKNIFIALGIVTINWMQQQKGWGGEHADPRELPNQLTSNSGTNFYIAS